MTSRPAAQRRAATSDIRRTQADEQAERKPGTTTFETSTPTRPAYPGIGSVSSLTRSRKERRERDVQISTGDGVGLVAVTDDAQVEPAIPARQAPQDRPVGPWVQSGVPREEVLRDERSPDDDDPRREEDRDQPGIEPEVRRDGPRAAAPRSRGGGGGAAAIVGSTSRAVYAVPHRCSDGGVVRGGVGWGGRPHSARTDADARAPRP